MKPTSHSTAYEKRHTKPCRFFQKGVCPLSADHCDFAHVKIQILPVRYSYGYSRPIQERQCDDRESPQSAAPTMPIEFGTQKSVVPGTEFPSLENVVAVVQPTHVHSRSLRRSTHPPVAAAKVPHVSRPYPRVPVLLPVASAQQPAPNVPYPVSVSSEDVAQLIFRGGESSPTSDVPSLSDGDSEPPSAACEAPELTERWLGSPPVTSPVVYYSPTPGLFSPGVPFTHPVYGPWTPPVGKQATHPESRRHGMSTRKLKALKTKHCKFFKKDGRCPQGSLCTFIHDPSAIQSPKSEQESPLDTSCYSSEAPSGSEAGSYVGDDHGQNIHPVTWRVIGGGVMMGGRREVCPQFKDGVCPEGDDCPYAHLRDDDTQTPIEATTSTSTPRASYFPQGETHERNTKQVDPPASRTHTRRIPDGRARIRASICSGC
ncbi:hypothetical protein F5148DRAFT_831701 [Russula earlei]|uniref:Uncharacterized protein n=1 Tax=Russula earlei TaxID=71964 RepID=A0ACC0UBI8_9AGAM|nr:hypothetical protein F5148DRAFT_831701 [Russula earlei]